MASSRTTWLPRRCHTEPSSRPIDAGADHAQAFRDGGEVERARGIDDDLAVDRNGVDVAWQRAGGDEDVLGLEGFAGSAREGRDVDAHPGEQARPCRRMETTLFLAKSASTPAASPRTILSLRSIMAGHVDAHLAGA